MNITIASSIYSPHNVGGAELTTQQVAEGLQQRGHRVSVITLTPNEKVERTELNGVRIIRVPLSNTYWPFPRPYYSPARKLWWHIRDVYNPVMSSRFREALLETSAEVVQSHLIAGFSVSAWRAIASLGLPHVHVLHDYYLLCIKSTMVNSRGNCTSRCLNCRVGRAPHRELSKKLLGVTAVSRHVLEEHERHGYFEGVRLKSVVFNAYEPPETRVKELSPPARLNTSMPRDAFRIGFLGQIQRVKGIEVLLRAFEQLGLPNAFVLVGGKGPDEYVGQLRKIFSSGNIVFLGKVRPSEFFSSIDLLVVPSTWDEPFGRVAIEAFAHGVPVIASRAGGLKEIVRDNIVGKLFAPNDAEELGRLLGAVARDRTLLKRWAEGALLESASYTLAGTIDKHENILRNVFAFSRDATGPVVKVGGLK